MQAWLFGRFKGRECCLTVTSSITYMVITAVLSLCGYSEENRLGYIYAGLVCMLFIYGELIFDSLVPLALAAFLLFIYIFGIILEDHDKIQA